MAPVDPTELLAHAAWLRRLARSLIAERAEDLVQDTWVAALRRPPDGERSVGPWLRTVLTNLARLRWRSDAHRSAREQVAASLGDREAPSSEQLLERHELQQLLARLVGELDEPFRSTILLRFAEGLTPTQIARRLAIPPSTVRWRLKEALARLRAQLDAMHRGDRRTWLAALAPLALPRQAASSPVIPLVAAAGAVAVVGVWLAVGDSTPPAVVAPRPTPVVAHAPPVVATQALAWLAQEGAPRRTLSGRVVVDGAPAAGVPVRLLADPLPAREVTTDAKGRFDFGDQPPRELVLTAAQPGRLAAIRRVDLRDPTTPREVELVLDQCVASLYGTVTDASGAPIARAELLREGVVGAETDAAGRYELCMLPTSSLAAELGLLVRADGFGALATMLAPAGRVRRDFVLAPEAAVAGRVVAPDGAPIASARVTLALTEADPPERGLSLSAVTDRDGEFRIAGLAAGAYGIAAASPEAVAAPVAVRLGAGENRQLELRASPTGVVRGRVIARGAPVAGVTVAAGGEAALSQPDGSFVLARVPIGDVELATTRYRRTSGAIHVIAGDRNRAEITVEPLGVLRGTIRRHGVPVPFARVDISGPSRVGITTDVAGRYEARGLEAGKYGYYCDDRRRGAMFWHDHTIELGTGELRELDIELAWGGAIEGHVVDGRGAPVAGAQVRFQADVGSHCTTDDAGAFVCGGLSGGTYTATVSPGSAAAHPFRFVEPPPALELRDGDARIDGLRLVVEPTLLAIAGTVIDGAGAPVPDTAVRALAGDRRHLMSFRSIPETLTDGDGHFRIAELSPGEYHVEVEGRGRATRRTVAAGATNVSLVLDRARCDGTRGHELPPTLSRAPTPVVWDQQIELVGWSVPATATVGAPFDLTLVYRALRASDREWTIFAHFDSPGRRLNADHDPGLGWCPTSRWQTSETIVDRVTARFEKPGRYALTIGFFTGRAPDWVNLPLSSAPGEHGAHIADVAVE